MTSTAYEFLNTLKNRTEEILDACTSCGACLDVCPTPDLAGIKIDSSESVTRGVLDILRDGDGPAASRQWASNCCGSGHCLNVCERGINPRFMLLMARRALSQENTEIDRRTAGKNAFKTMSPQCTCHLTPANAAAVIATPEPVLSS